MAVTDELTGMDVYKLFKKAGVALPDNISRIMIDI